MKTYKNILIVRTDRIGDVLLTTPAIAALRKHFSSARISILVSPATREIVEGNPHIDEVMVDDRKGGHRGLLGFWKLVFEIKKRKFDLAIVFHTKKRTNFLCYHAGIPERIGYRNNKCGFLLTKQIEDLRPQGTTHEVQYCLDVVKHLGVVGGDLKLFMPLKPESDQWAKKAFKDFGIQEGSPVVAVHPGASCISKRWPAERFAELIRMMPEDVRIVLVGSQENSQIASQIQFSTKKPILDLIGKASLSQLAGVLRRCRLLISNDSGPVHVAVAVETPVISIFGRNQAGLSPARWRPLGPKDVVIHKEVGCEVCLAHNCIIDFECLKAVSPEEVLKTAQPFLTSTVSSV